MTHVIRWKKSGDKPSEVRVKVKVPKVSVNVKKTD
jgi:hypothetical protein